MLAFFKENAKELIALVGVALVGVGVSKHDVGAGLAVAGVLLVGLAVYAAHIERS